MTNTERTGSAMLRHATLPRNVRRILVRGVNAPLPPEAKKFRKFDEMVHSEVYLNKCGQHSAILYTCLP